jgi:hypothetical protein
VSVFSDGRENATKGPVQHVSHLYQHPAREDYQRDVVRRFCSNDIELLYVTTHDLTVQRIVFGVCGISTK